MMCGRAPSLAFKQVIFEIGVVFKFLGTVRAGEHGFHAAFVPEVTFQGFFVFVVGSAPEASVST